VGSIPTFPANFYKMGAMEKLRELYPSSQKISDEAFERLKSRKIKHVENVTIVAEGKDAEAINKALKDAWVGETFGERQTSHGAKRAELLKTGDLVQVEHVTWLEPSLNAKGIREEKVLVEQELMRKWKAEKDPIFMELKAELEAKYPEGGMDKDKKWKCAQKLANGFPDIERVYGILSES
jgi:hypothetical protein